MLLWEMLDLQNIRSIPTVGVSALLVRAYMPRENYKKGMVPKLYGVAERCSTFTFAVIAFVSIFPGANGWTAPRVGFHLWLIGAG